MKKRLLLLAFLAAFAARFSAQTLSDSARISLMTVAPGEEMYSLFGHSAIRVFDPATRFDRCYNYGTFEFDQPNFLLKFCRGQLLYYLNVEPYRYFERGNLLERRAMQEQFLDLQPAERQRLFDLLQENAREENRYYKYDFFYDNCATRIRDVLKETFFHQIQFDTAGLEKSRTMRQLLRPYLADFAWTQFGIDLILGLPADRRADPENWMFLPDHLHDLMATVRLDSARTLIGSERRLPSTSFPAPAARAADPVDWLFGSPFWVMCLVALIGLLSMANPRAERVFDAIFWFSLGATGLLMALLWFATDHSATKNNLNILWALPTHLLFFGRSRRSELTDNYFVGAAILAALTLLFWKFLPQEMPLAALPLAALVVVKGLFRRQRTV